MAKSNHADGTPNMRARVGLACALAVFAVSTALSACGGSEEQVPPPKLPRALGSDLATQSDAVAESLDAGEACQAAEQARGLQQAVQDAIAADEVPRALRRPLVSAVEPLCERPEEPAVSCDALEAKKQELEEQKKEIEKAFKEDKEERERRKKAIEEEKKALEEELRACRENVRERRASYLVSLENRSGADSAHPVRRPRQG